MTSTPPGDATIEVAIAEAFGRPAPAWALEAAVAEHSDYDLAMARTELNLAACFRREPDPQARAIVEAAERAASAPAAFVTEGGVRKRVQ